MDPVWIRIRNTGKDTIAKVVLYLYFWLFTVFSGIYILIIKYYLNLSWARHSFFLHCDNATIFQGFCGRAKNEVSPQYLGVTATGDNLLALKHCQMIAPVVSVCVCVSSI